jgi:hypothetical protein
MFSMFIALFWSLVCPNHTDKANHNDSEQVTTMDTGGETGHVPPHPLTPPKTI